MTTKKEIQEVSELIAQEGRFYRLTLSTEGKLFVDPELEAPAEWYWLYHDGSFYCQEDREFPEEDLEICTIVGATAVNPIEDVGVFLHSTAPVIGEEDAYIVLLKYQKVLVMVVAVGLISRAIYTTLLAYTDDDEDFMKKNFTDLVRRCDPEIALQLLVKQSMKSDLDLTQVLAL